MTWINACFVRGGTSKGVFFRAEDLGVSLPVDASSGIDETLCAVMGSPDLNGRQLGGMGGGISSLSKVMIVDRSEREGVDLDYTFGQVEVAKAEVDYSGNCGNLTSAVLPFAIESGLIEACETAVLFNTNTGKLVHVRFGEGEVELPGVSGKSQPIELSYPDPVGSRTAGLLPTGNSRDVIAGVEASLVDATLPLVIVPADAVGLQGIELPKEIDAQPEVMARLEQLRQAGGRAMGLEPVPEAVPDIAVVAPAQDAETLDGAGLSAQEVDVNVRVISMRKAHLAVPGTAAMCLAAASAAEGTVVAALTGGKNRVRLGTPSGAVIAASEADHSAVTLIRTARILMRGQVQA